MPVPRSSPDRRRAISSLTRGMFKAITTGTTAGTQLGSRSYARGSQAVPSRASWRGGRLAEGGLGTEGLRPCPGTGGRAGAG
jgi:hypothetical protein